MAFKPQKFSASEISTEIPVLDKGAYAGLLHISVEEKSGDNYISSIRVKPSTKVENGERVPTGDWELSGTLIYRVELTSKKAIQLLKQDKPQIFARPVKINFNQETGNFDLTSNPVIAKITNTLLTEHEDAFGELYDTVWSRMEEQLENVEIPDELSNVPNIETLYPSSLFMDELFREWTLLLSGSKVKVMVNKVNPSRLEGGKYVTDKSTYVNQIDQGNSWPISKSGLLAYNDGDEFDLEN